MISHNITSNDSHFKFFIFKTFRTVEVRGRVLPVGDAVSWSVPENFTEGVVVVAMIAFLF